MNDISPELKREWIVRALGIAGFTEKENYQGMHTQEHGMKTVVVDLNVTPIKSYFNVDGKKITEDDEHKTLEKVDTMIAEAEDGRMPSKTEPDIIVTTTMHGATPEQPEKSINQETAQYIKDTESLSDDDPAKVTAEMVTVPQAIQPSVPSDLSVQTIKKYINDKATDEEAYVFLQLCKARGLNPFLKEAHLIKYSHTAPATMVVGKDAFTRKAEEHKQFDGFEAGIIVRVAEDTPVEERLGSFMEKGETLLGGWAKVYRKDHKYPSVCTVSFLEYYKPGRNGKKNNWDNIPATMIRKVALVQAHREAFSSEMSGMYDQSEIGVEVSV
ncbi:MAG: phage recombination protein Bet [Candidatus Omnitrophica bacterium]|nr:phage recombination protein Bet [Candidatus Omnitrophota bacterium]